MKMHLDFESAEPHEKALMAIAGILALVAILTPAIAWALWVFQHH